MNNIPKFISIELLSDTCCACAEGTAGIVDTEVEHDELGIPFIGGKAIQGVLRDSWLSMEKYFDNLNKAFVRIHGIGQDMTETSILCIANAQVDKNIKEWIEYAVNRDSHPLNPNDILYGFTDIRTPTAQDRKTGAPAETSLRSIRTVIRGFTLNASLSWLNTPDKNDLRCLALSVLGVRHIGLNRNRGLGYIRMLLDNNLDKTIRFAKGESE